MCTPPGTLFLVFLTLPPPSSTCTHTYYAFLYNFALLLRSKVSPVIQSSSPVHCLQTPEIITVFVIIILSIFIINVGIYYDHDNNRSIHSNTSEEYEADYITVSVEWAQQVGTMYTVRVLPLPLVPIMATGSTSRQLTISYNTVYNLSVEATAPCRANATAFIRLHYGKVY